MRDAGSPIAAPQPARAAVTALLMLAFLGLLLGVMSCSVVYVAGNAVGVW